MPAHAKATEVIVVTGASRGIGLAVAKRFARKGFAVMLAARDRARLEDAAGDVRTLGVPVETLAIDLGEFSAGDHLIRATLAQFGRIDVLVNNAGVAPLAAIADMSDHDFDVVQKVNMQAVFTCTRAAWRSMQTQRSGVILTTSSVAALDPFPGFAVYGATKAWVNTFTLALAAEGAPLGIRVYAIAPGAVETDLLRARFPDFPANQTLSPDDVATVFEELYEDKAGQRSGQSIVVRK